MAFGSDPGNFLMTVLVLLVAFLALDLLVAGGGMTGGMMGGMAGMMGTPWGWGLLLLLAVAVLLLFVDPGALPRGWAI